jgi:hypothetical protein
MSDHFAEMSMRFEEGSHSLLITHYSLLITHYFIIKKGRLRKGSPLNNPYPMKNLLQP